MANNIKEVSQDLHDTLESGEHIEKVYFTKTGDHFFNVHEYEERVKSKDNAGYFNRKTGRLFGGMLTEVVEETVTLRGGAIDKKMFIRNKPNPKTEIAVTLTRDEVLALPIREEDEQEYIPQLPQRRKPGRKPNKVQSAE